MYEKYIFFAIVFFQGFVCGTCLVHRCIGLTQFSTKYLSRRDALLVRASLALRVAALYYYCCGGVCRDHNLQRRVSTLLVLYVVHGNTAVKATLGIPVSSELEARPPLNEYQVSEVRQHYCL